MFTPYHGGNEEVFLHPPPILSTPHPSPLPLEERGNLHCKICFFHMLIIKKFTPFPFQYDPPVFKDIGTMADLKGVVDILLHQKNGNSFPINLSNSFEGAGDQHGLKSQRGFIQKKKIWF